jgi:hypothetical protein
MIALAENNRIVNALQGHVVKVSFPQCSVRCNEEKAGGANIC